MIADKINGLHFFLMSNGEYSEYRVGGLYVCDHPITEDEWHQFCKDDFEFVSKTLAEMGTARYHNGTNLEAWHKGRKWRQDRGSVEELFAKKHGMTPVETTELHLDWD